MSSQVFRGVPGVPDGWELVRIDFVTEGEWYIFKGRVDQWESKRVSDCDFPIVRKIEAPKQYRPFANAEEFKPHRDRWWAWKDDRQNTFHPASYGIIGHSRENWAESFQRKVFDDGTPFGVEVSE